MPELTVKSLITPHDQTLRTVFNTQRSYFIDIYQREYKWQKEEVTTLLNDIEVRFSQYSLTKKQPKEIQEDVLERFEPYFLNTYLTHTTAENISIVDGQQRLTTLLLMLIKLHKVLKEVEKDSSLRGKTFSSKIIEQLIYATNDFGEAERFKIFNDNREDAFRALIEEKTIEPKDETRRRINENYKEISLYYDKFLSSGNPVAIDLVKTTYYITYLLDRISIVEIRIERQQNVSMIFEVVNDRGRGLQPYEILKGKLIGGLSIEQKEKANLVWTEMQDKYFKAVLKNTTEKSVDLDIFFRTFFRSKFADSENDYEKFEKDYHYEMYRNPKIRTYFADFQDRDLLFSRITEDFCYYADLYLKMRTSYENENIIFNKLLDQNQQYLLILSSIKTKDPKETEKIDGIARKFDQIHVVLRLLNAYDSNEFQRIIYPLIAAVRNKPLIDAVATFDSTLIETLVSRGSITAGQHKEVKDLFEYDRFKNISNNKLNFSKYILMRIDRHLAQLLDKPSYVSTDLEDLEDRFNRNNNKRYGLHLEHIITQHKNNLALFTTKGAFDENAFHQTRNLLGMVLLLKDRQNISSNDEIYADKLDTYTKSNFIWNELLSGHLPKVDIRNLPIEFQLPKISPLKNGAFPINKVEDRQRAMFAAIKAIWGF